MEAAMREIAVAFTSLAASQAKLVELAVKHDMREDARLELNAAIMKGASMIIMEVGPMIQERLARQQRPPESQSPRQPPVEQQPPRDEERQVENVRPQAVNIAQASSPPPLQSMQRRNRQE